MKTRMHRFWLSITLAAGSLVSPLSTRLSAHDLPWRWASDTVSSSDWNYLRDDCLDSRALSRYGDALSKSLECTLGSCPTEQAVANRFDAALAHRSAAKFASEMACWASKWEQMQKKAGEVARARLVSRHQEALSQWAARPELGTPPSPAEAIADTCSFEAEYRAMQSAADLLDAEVARAAEISAKEAELGRALAAAAAIEAAAIDAIAQNDLNPSNGSDPSFCGGEQNEIVSQQRPHSDFAPPVDEYMAYDLDGREAHWLGGLGKSWRLRAAISASATAQADLAAEESSAADSFGADELIESAPAGSGAAASSHLVSEIIEAPSIDDFALCDFVGPVAPSSERIAEQLIAARPDAGLAPAPGVELALKERLANGLDWLDHASCIVAAEMCGLDQTHRLGEQWGEWTLDAAQRSMTTYVAMGHYLSLPPMVHVPAPDLEPKSNVYVVYTDTQGYQTTVPSTLGPAWNTAASLTGQSDGSLDEASYLLDEFAAFESNGTVAEGSEPAASPAAANAWNLAQLRRHVLNLAARELDAIGMSCLQTADRLSNWADPQIASREDNDVR